VPEEAQPRNEDPVGLGRIVAFSDNVFAVAITLLVLSIGAPKLTHAQARHDLGDKLWGTSGQVLVYFFTFALIGLFWIGHHRFFGEVRDFDTGLIALNLVYLALIAFLPFPSAVFGDHTEVESAVVFFALSMGMIGIADAGMLYYAGRRGLLRRSFEKDWRPSLWRILVVPAVFFGSIPIAIVAPSVAPWMWLVVFPITRLPLRRRSLPSES
jgi:uncharacterized membrane protein